MQCNVGGADRIVRVILGVVLLLSILLLEGNWRWLGLVPLLTGLASWCPLYTLFGIRTCPKEAGRV